MAATKKSTQKKTTRSQKNNGNMSEAESALMELFVDEIKDIYWAEKHLVKTLPKLAKGAASEALKDAINEHLEITKTHVSRLEEVFELLDKRPQAKKCEAMEGLAQEGASVLEDTEAGTATRDVGIILAAQKTEHYEIATYGGLSVLAKTLRLIDVANLLDQTLAEEKEADETLTSIAENSVNIEALEE
ncbi:ferritin-like domain-containing protein [Niabella sp. CC-SYL272]|uniref:YciE/YciF ferroxidase family protein n=1 Tax=Niabella agricola TaxID=2891571 RepID=UPI001F373287|nr:ferritin-like domain-containing protein [Niabella agricola]MCF3109390.1 ferritin-like domain-containing protein [Niabella agricola]